MGLFTEFYEAIFTKKEENTTTPITTDPCLDWKKKVTQIATEKAEMKKAHDAKVTELENKIFELTIEETKEIIPINFREQNKTKIKNDYTYPCRGWWKHDAFGKKWASIKMDLRQFCTPNEYSIKSQAVLFKNLKTNDEKMEAIRKWVFKNTNKSGVNDSTEQGVDEFHQFSYETLQTKKVDCEDAGYLIRDLAEAAGVPSERLLNLACDSLNSGHAVCIYCRETDNEWVTIDTVYFYTSDPINTMIKLKDDNRYKKYWWAFNNTTLYKNPVI